MEDVKRRFGCSREEVHPSIIFPSLGVICNLMIILLVKRKDCAISNQRFNLWDEKICYISVYSKNFCCNAGV